MAPRPATAYKLTPDQAPGIIGSLCTPAAAAFPLALDGRVLYCGPAARDSRFDLVLRRPPSMLHLAHHIERVRRLQSDEAKALANIEFYGAPARRAMFKDDPAATLETYGRCLPVAVHQTWFGWCTLEAERLAAAGVDAVVVSDATRCAIYARPVVA